MILNYCGHMAFSGAYIGFMVILVYYPNSGEPNGEEHEK